MALVNAGNTSAPIVRRLSKVLLPNTPVADDTILENWPVIGSDPKLLKELVKAELTPKLDPSPAMAPAPGNMPAPAMLITALRGPPQLMLESHDYISTAGGHEGTSSQI
jgi:hypothetical protein